MSKRAIRHLPAREHMITADGTWGAWVSTADVAVGDVLTIDSPRLGSSYIAAVTEIIPYLNLAGEDYANSELVRVARR